MEEEEDLNFKIFINVGDRAHMGQKKGFVLGEKYKIGNKYLPNIRN